jgi:hypothetical protein
MHVSRVRAHIAGQVHRDVMLALLFCTGPV